MEESDIDQAPYWRKLTALTSTGSGLHGLAGLVDFACIIHCF